MRDSEFLDYLKNLKYTSLDYRGPSEEHEGYYQIDITGEAVRYLYDTYPKDEYLYYHCFESIFEVPEEIFLMMRLKFGQIDNGLMNLQWKYGKT